MGRVEKGGEEENGSGIGNTKRVQEREERPVKKRGVWGKNITTHREGVIAEV